MRAPTACLVLVLVASLSAVARAERPPLGFPWDDEPRRERGRSRTFERELAHPPSQLTRATLTEQLALVEPALRACLPEGHRPVRARVLVSDAGDVQVRTGLPRRERDTHLCITTEVLRAVIPVLGLPHRGPVRTVLRIEAATPLE